MVSFARARTRSWLDKLWPVKGQTNKNEIIELEKSKELIDQQKEQNNLFLEAINNGGIWFS